jgi:hypothetical protein
VEHSRPERHPMPEQLALAALREPLPAEDAAHLASCAECRAEVASLRRGVDALAIPEFASQGASVAPPPRVWAAIAAATGVTASPSVDPTVGTQPAAATPLAAAPPLPPDPAPAEHDNVRVLRPRRTRLLLAAAAVAVVAAGAGAIALNRDDTVTLASTDLAPLDSSRATGTASVVEADDGTRMLRIELDAPAAKDGLYEAWLADPSAVRMISMGNVSPGTTSLPVPDGVDLADWPTVEISVEPLDGDPNHSGVSLVRGALDT